MSDSKYYHTDPDDPEAPIVLTRYSSGHGEIKPGDAVEYVNPEAAPLPAGPLIVAELVAFGTDVQAILNDGQYEVSADNLRPLPRPDMIP